MNQISAGDKTAPERFTRVKSQIVNIWTAFIRHPIVADNVFISQQFEFRFILKFCSCMLLGGLLFTALILYHCSGSLTTSFNHARLVIKQTSLMVFPGVLYTNLIVLFLISVISVVMTFYFSHRIRKPLFRFREDIEAIAMGDLTKKIHYRNKDLTTSLAQNINMMTANLNSKISEIEAEITKTIGAASDRNIPDELLIELKQLQQAIQNGFIL